jgi:hypothetical protein
MDVGTSGTRRRGRLKRRQREAKFARVLAFSDGVFAIARGENGE